MRVTLFTIEARGDTEPSHASWARVVHALGAGPAPVPFPTLTAARLAAAIDEAVTSPAMRGRAAELGARIKAEDGPARAIDLFLGHVGARR